MASHKQETLFDLGSLFQEINRSFTEAALELSETFRDEAWKDQPFVYHMPRMQVSVSLELSHSDGTVKGVFRKRSSESTETLSSRIDVEVVSVPRVASASAALPPQD